jgi:hypothetical protein
MLMICSGTAFDAASNIQLSKSALMTLRKSFTNIKIGRCSNTHHFQTTELTQKAIKYE